MGGMGIGASPGSCAEKAGRCITNESNDSGGEKASQCRRNSRTGAGCGLRMARAFANVLSIGTHVWAYDFVADCTHDGRPLKILTLVEEYSRECLAIVVARGLRSIDVLETLAALFVTHGVPAHLRSDNGPEFTAELIRLWLEALQVQTLFIEPGSPWENGYVESFNGQLRDELLDREIF